MQGHCLCGAISFTTSSTKEIGVCHCGYCRRWGGGPLLAVHCGADFEVKGAEFVQKYASSEWAERAFCKQCGTHLYYKLLSTGEHFVPAGALESNDLHMATQIFIDNKPDYYAFSNETQTLTEAQVLALYGMSADEEGA